MATIHDVAKAAGVSGSTVSYVLSGKRSISAETRARVEQAIRDLGYRPHAGARALASARTDVLGLVAPLRADVNVSVILEFVAGVVTRARSAGLDVLLLTQDDSGGIERVTSGSMVDGLVVMDIESHDPRIADLVAIQQPVVLIGLPARPHGLSCVDLDFAEAGRLAVTRLHELGHTEVALIGPTPRVVGRHTSYADRLLRGYSDGVAEAGLEPLIELSEGTPAGGRAAVAAALDERPELTALVVHNEAALPGVLNELRARGRSIPRDLSVIAVCPAGVATAQSRALTAVDIPAVRIGQTAVDMVVDRLGGETGSEIRLVAPVITERDSTGPRSS
ncbi:MAG TPA: LacI family DNA-binding transcriptional regulator [Microlunatus sp.]